MKSGFVAIIGKPNAGKSTLLNVLSGLDSYEEGEMYINGEETSHYSEEDFEMMQYLHTYYCGIDDKLDSVYKTAKLF